ncbi:MAG: metallophosphoesterase [Bacteroidales bacterium]|nr:metallophosphoesterase [Bacteroidales bacterium]
MRKLSLFFVISFLCVLSACTKVDSIETINPFSNGGKERNMIVVLSDIHLGADLTYAECSKNLGALEMFLKQVKTSRNVKELVIAGDMLDEWFIPATIDIYKGKDQADFVKRIATANKGVIDAFNSIIREGKILVTYVPGNHDLTITAQNVEKILPGINQARDLEQGLGTYSPADYPKIAIEHGHRYNFFCAPDPISNQDIAPGTILPPGYFFTRIGVHSYMNNFPPAGDIIPAVTPNTSGNASQSLLFIYWNVWSRTLIKYTIPNKFDEKFIVTNMDGFKGTYSVNDILPYQNTLGGFIDVKLYKGIQDTWNQRQTLNHVAVNIPVSQAIANAAKASESDDQAKNQYFLNPDSDKRIVIFGHTHEPKIISSNNHNGQKSIYANTGTWIDHNSVASTIMSFVVITPQNTKASSLTFVKLYNFEKEIVTKMAEDSLRY